MEFEGNVRDLVQSEFIRNIWLRKTAEQDLHESLMEFIEFRKKLDSNLAEHFHEDTLRSVTNLEIQSKRVGLLAKILDSLQYIQQDAADFLEHLNNLDVYRDCLLYTSPSPRDRTRSRMPSSA